MPYPPRLLDADERVVLDLRPHGRRLVLPVLAVPTVVGVAAFLAGVAPHTRYLVQERLVVVGFAVLVVARVSLWPWLRWRARGYTLTTRRLVVRSGVLRREAREVRLGRIVDVTVRRTLLERVLRAGTLTVKSAGEQGRLSLSDVPRVEDVQRELARLCAADDRRPAAPDVADEVWARPGGGRSVRR